MQFSTASLEGRGAFGMSIDPSISCLGLYPIDTIHTCGIGRPLSIVIQNIGPKCPTAVFDKLWYILIMECYAE